jgi:hypothetical protein
MLPLTTTAPFGSSLGAMNTALKSASQQHAAWYASVFFAKKLRHKTSVFLVMHRLKTILLAYQQFNDEVTHLRKNPYAYPGWQGAVFTTLK